MRQLKIALLVSTLVLVNLTACADAQKTAAQETSRGERQRGNGMSQSERSSKTQTVGKNRTEEKARDSGSFSDGTKNNNVNASDSEKVVSGKVKSIVGNEVVLIITPGNGITTSKNKENAGRTDSQNTSNAAGSSEPAAPTVDRSASPESAATEETQTYLIPVGMAVGSKDFSAIKAGNTLKIYFGTDSVDGDEIITAVELR